MSVRHEGRAEDDGLFGGEAGEGSPSVVGPAVCLDLAPNHQPHHFEQTMYSEKFPST